MTLTQKQATIAFGILMAFFMALAMSFIMVLINVGMVPSFFILWMKSFLIGFLVAVPTSMIAAPVSKKLLKKLTYNG
ncbi:DUF2798 domain-containing protein [Tenacibaculum discolor]|uniref:DUF2798 domain-containing protein n=1 Tax=Tenacibaculum discolor TaxID=361581 RepID=A0A2G1BVV0_9FLAO|nr:DUF2798 domain-containing protein [Tenacibaculum discolor]MDP2540030.1 DUF2798 domain-containing protein [Tenacibaculum discolor]PHN97989.1 hypothetical protein CSC81_06165 [Tenacibaculum discolor]PHO01947.1 hypothetical protein CSC82_20965 [Rhodobacteraceae bacterium 4F10]